MLSLGPPQQTQWVWQWLMQVQLLLRRSIFLPDRYLVMRSGSKIWNNQIMIIAHFLSELPQIALSTSQEPVAQCRATISKEANYWCLSTTLTASEQREDIVEYYGRSRPQPLLIHSQWLHPLLQMLRPLLVLTVTFIFLTLGNGTTCKKIWF